MQPKIVIVDDDESLRDVAQLIFERAGYDTIVISNAQPLYERKYADASLILLDRQLSGTDGLEVCRYLKDEPLFAHIPVLIMSATSHLSEDLKELPADGFIEKPFRKNDLLKRVADVLAQVM